MAINNNAVIVAPSAVPGNTLWQTTKYVLRRTWAGIFREEVRERIKETPARSQPLIKTGDKAIKSTRW